MVFGLWCALSVAAVHRDEVDVHVDEEVALRGAAVERHHFPLSGVLQLHHPVRVLGVVVVVAVRMEGVEDFLPDHPLHLGVGHSPVERGGDDEMDVVHAGIGEQFQDNLQHRLAGVGGDHRRERERDVVQGDGDLHPRPEEGVEGVHSLRVIQCPADGGLGVGHALQWASGEHHAGPQGQVF